MHIFHPINYLDVMSTWFSKPLWIDEGVQEKKKKKKKFPAVIITANSLCVREFGRRAEGITTVPQGAETRADNSCTELIMACSE